MLRSVTITESIFVARPPEAVWDFTQDYARRAQWDDSILEATVFASDPAPRVRVRARGGLTAVFQYRQFERPARTSLAMVEVSSRWFSGGGGAWSYEAQAGGTSWTQVNTLVLADRWWSALLAPLLASGLRSGTQRSMRRAKSLLESGRAG